MINSIPPYNPKTNRHAKIFQKKYHLVNLGVLLEKAREHNFGVPAINVRRPEIAQGSLRAAFSEKSPLILEIAESELGYVGLTLDDVVKIVDEQLAELIEHYGFMIPLCLHLDHLQKDIKLADKAIKSGFSSIACDQSKKPIEENIAVLKPLADKCHEQAVSVEGELGEIGQAGASADKNILENIEKYVPTADECLRFARETQIDVLAIFVGTTHGQDASTLIIAWQRAREIQQKFSEQNINMPFVLHGGSYTETREFDLIEVFQEAIRNRFAKFNYSTITSDIFYKYLPPDLRASIDQTAKGHANWRKVLGRFKKEIDGVDQKRRYHAIIEIKSHLKMMMREAWNSSDKARLFPEELYTL